ncbi:hypothetical protein [Photorhabdus luminescens]|uniref:hypothetical protein n=1 Tax=Photorhabdus luminescens TaxID=29488 RepID=UPI001051C1FE|nr:hypothetical protein [Photorhabdus luminescens]
MLASRIIDIYTIFVRNGINIQYAFNFFIAGLDARLNRRYQSLVEQPMTLAPTIKDIASAQKSTFATTQAVWRFLNNGRISFHQLNQPMIELTRQGITQSPHAYALVVHNRSCLQFASHHHETDWLQMTHARDIGYELQTSLLVDAVSGLPIAPLTQSLTDNTGCHSTQDKNRLPREIHLGPAGAFKP